MSGSIPYKTSLLPLTHQVLEHSEIQIQMPTFFLFRLQLEDSEMPTFQHTLIFLFLFLVSLIMVATCKSVILPYLVNF